MNVVSIRAGIIPVEDVGGRIAVAVLMAQHSLAAIKGNVLCLVRGKIYSLWGTILFVIIEEESPIMGKGKDDLFFIHRTSVASEVAIRPLHSSNGDSC